MGFTAEEITIGVVINSEFENQALAAGASVAVGDQEGIAIAIADALNAEGGIAGRRVRVTFYDTRGEQGQDPSTVAQAACVHFTEDDPVFAAMTSVSQVSTDNFYACLAQRGVVSIGGVLGGGFDAAAQLEAFAPYLYLPAGPTVERMTPLWMRRLHANDYFVGWDTTLGRAVPGEPVIGLLYGANGDATGPIADALAVTVERELEALGYRLAAKIETTGFLNEHSQAVLRFRDAGVTHVIGDAALIQFLPAAAAQGYRPRYGLGSMSGPALLTLVAPPGQLTGALGLGFNPPLDVDNARDPGDVSPAQAWCREVLRDAGHDTNQRLAWAVMALSCDAFNFLDATIEAGGLSPEGVRRGTQVIGSMPPASTFAISFAGGSVAGASAARDLAWAEECRCFMYTSTTDHPM